VSGSTHDDFLLREVEAVAAMVARIMGLRGAGATKEARVALEKAYSLLLAPQTDLLRRLDPATAAIMLASPEKVLALARLTAEEGEQEADAERRTRLRTRAIELLLEALSMRPGDRQATAFLADLGPRGDLSALTPEHRRLLEETLARF
jgi:hypothetical protein